MRVYSPFLSWLDGSGCLWHPCPITGCFFFFFLLRSSHFRRRVNIYAALFSCNPLVIHIECQNSIFSGISLSLNFVMHSTPFAFIYYCSSASALMTTFLFLFPVFRFCSQFFCSLSPNAFHSSALIPLTVCSISRFRGISIARDSDTRATSSSHRWSASREQ